jgi:hypothetical protein
VSYSGPLAWAANSTSLRKFIPQLMSHSQWLADRGTKGLKEELTWCYDLGSRALAHEPSSIN